MPTSLDPSRPPGRGGSPFESPLAAKRCQVPNCAAYACFGFGGNLLKNPPDIGRWYCAEHRALGAEWLTTLTAPVQPTLF